MMLKRNRSPQHPPRRVPARVAVVAAEYNRKHVDSLLDGAVAVLREAGAEVEVVRVPGAFEIPLVVELLASKGDWGAILCLGLIIRGETAHADLIGESVTRALMEIGLRHRVPVVHEVLLVANLAQADVRCLDPRHNRGVEAAGTALEMVQRVARLPRMRGRGSPDA